MHPSALPPEDVQHALKKKTIEEVTARGTAQRYTLDYLVDRCIASNGDQQKVTVAEILEALGAKGPASESACRVAINHLREKMRDQARRVWVGDWTMEISEDRGNYHVYFKHRATPPLHHFPKEPSAVDIVRAFWKPYLQRNSLTDLSVINITYSEPQFFRDRQGTYFRSPFSNKESDVSKLDYLHLDRDGYESCHSFVQAGIVAGMMSLVGYMTKNSVAVETSIARQQPPSSKNSHRIVLGTPHTNSTIIDIEQRSPFPFYTTHDKGVVFVDEQRSPLVDEYGERLAGTKWVVITRTNSRQYPDRAITSIASCLLGRAVEAVATRLSQPALVQKIADGLGCGGHFPDHFQVICRIQMARANDGSWAGSEHCDVEVIEAEPINPQQTKSFRKAT